ncbi:probable cyclin-dependent serine/threonine-protein kinase DDB_G0292550 [Chenopodium quinoa]|uniref:probable cyclin-dependent serine/threonine-protein kinase DDB_G0292550 n=1 Tax=Chenopodium quinoa TaxID=63459 RepID=UPI000B77401F|nr:probable cyclin-dependent serine/threonine-protein kinase DDB_G0292550 [Chenopodium quinoa]
MAGERSSGSGGNDLNDLVRQLAAVAQQLARNSTGNGDAEGELFKKVFETLDEVYGRAAHLYALEEKKKKELAEIEGREKRKEVGQVFGNQQRNQNGFKKQKYHHNNNFHNNNNFHGNNRQGNRNNNGGARNNNQGSNKNGRIYFCKRCRNNHPGRDCEGNLVACRPCNNLGHREYECYSKNANGNKQNNYNSGGNQKNFQGNNNNFSGNKGVQQNGVRNSNTNNSNSQQKGGTAGKLNVLSRHEAEATKDVITGTFSINSIPVKVLFDSGATFSFVSKGIDSKLKDCLKTVEAVDLPITIPTGGVVKCTKTFRYVPLEIKGRYFRLILLNLG